MAVYGDIDLQRYKLEPHLSLSPDMVQSVRYDTSRFDIADLLNFPIHLEMLANTSLVGFCTLGKLMHASYQRRQ